ncbi:MAG: hypothetical protein ABW025_04960 [Cellulomonas sp.]
MPDPVADGADDRVAALEREVAALRDQRDRAWMELQAMRRSTSWRVTWPLRRLRSAGRR